MKPPVFLDLDLTAALARAREQGRLLLVAMTSSRYPACETMDRFTWVHPDIVARMRERAMAIQIDGDADAATVEMLKVKGMPIVVAFNGGVEVDRVFGVLQAERILSWLDCLERGETHLQQLRREANENPKDVGRRMDLGAALINAGAYDEATTNDVWLWQHMLEHMPQMAGFKHYPFVDQLKILIAAHPPARDAFDELRHGSFPDLDAPDAERFAEWCSLNRALGEPAKTLAWFDEHRERALATPALAPALEEILEPLFIEGDRWPDLGRLYRDPVTKFGEKASLQAAVLADMAAMRALHAENPQAAGEGLNAVPGFGADVMAATLNAMNQSFRANARKFARALRAAGRDDEAKQIAEAAVAVDGSAEMAAALEVP